MASYQHFVRKTTDAPPLKTVTASSCSSSLWTFFVASHGYSIGDIVILSAFNGGNTINGTHTITNVLDANRFEIIAGCMSSIVVNGFVQLVDDSTYTQVYPLGFYPSYFIYEQPEGQIFFTRKLNGSLKFINQPKIPATDFSYFYNSELDSAGLVIDSCTGYDYIIKKECNGVYSNYYEAKFSLHDGQWDLDNCTFEVTPSPNTNYNCILNGVEVNIFDSVPVVTTLYEAGSNPDRNYTNSRTFEDVLSYLVTQTCGQIYGIVSDFFQINPETSSSISYVTGEVNPYTEMTIAAVKDVKEPVPATDQDVSLVSFVDFMKELNSIFDVYFTIENNFIRIEHVSYFDALTGIDLTQSTYDKYDTDRNKYTYIEVPRTETQISSNRNFLKVLYDNNCSIENKKDDKITSSYITTLAYILRLLPERYSGDDNGIVLFSTEYDSGLGKYVVIGNFNDTLWPTVTFAKFHRHNLAQPVGSLMIGDTEIYDEYLIYSSKKNKLQEEIKIPLCCDEEFEVEDKIKTGLGFGFVESAEFSIKDDVLKLQLKYGAPNVLDITSLSQINGLSLWLDAAVGVTSSGGFVSSWADLSGNGRDAVQATGAKQPSITTIDGFAALSFDGVDDGMSTSSFQQFPSKRGTVFIVFKCRIPTGAADRIDHIIGTNGSGAGTMWDIATTEDFVQLTKTVTSQTSGNTILLNVNIAQSTTTPAITYGYDNEFFLLSAIRISDTEIEGTGNGSLGVGVGSNRQSITVANSIPDPNPVNIGNAFVAGNSNPFYGYIAEIAIYDSSLGDYERQQVEQYFFKKYSVIKQYT